MTHSPQMSFVLLVVDSGSVPASWVAWSGPLAPLGFSFFLGRGNTEEEGGARGLTGDRSRLGPDSSDPRPSLPLGPAPAPRPSLTPPVRHLLHLLLLLLPPLGRGLIAVTMFC